MIVTWVTLNEVNDSVVEYGQVTLLDKRTTGSVSVFQDDGAEQRREYIHRVVLRNLIPGQKYCMYLKEKKEIFFQIHFSVCWLKFIIVVVIRMDGRLCFGLQRCETIQNLPFVWLFMAIWEKIMHNQ